MPRLTGRGRVGIDPRCLTRNPVLFLESQSKALQGDPTIMHRLLGVVLCLSVVISFHPAPARSQTLPSLPHLQQGQGWAGMVRGGLTLSSGEMDARSMDAAGAVVVGRSDLSGNVRMFLVTSRAKQGPSSPELESKRYAVESSLQRTLRGPVYLVANADWEKNATHGVDHRSSGSFGLGFTALQSQRSHLDLEGAGGFVREDLTTGKDDRFGSLAMLVRGRFAPEEGVELSSEVEWIANLEDSDDRHLHADASLSVQLWGPLEMSLVYLFFHDSQPELVEDPFNPMRPPSAAEGTQSTLTVQVGINF